MARRMAERSYDLHISFLLENEIFSKDISENCFCLISLALHVIKVIKLF